MKKFLLAFLLMFSTLSFSATTKDTLNVAQDTVVSKNENIQDIERLVDKYSGKVYDLVKEIAVSLKVPVEKLLTIIAKQALVEGIVYLIVGILSVLIIIKSYKVLKTIHFDEKHNPLIGETQADFLFIVNTIFMVAGCIMFLAFVFNLTTVVQGFVNPEFRIVEILSDTLK